MRVRELIEKLGKHPEDAEVLLDDGSGPDFVKRRALSPVVSRDESNADGAPLVVLYPADAKTEAR